MRKIFSTILFLLWIPFVHAQIKLGIKASPQYTWTSTDSKSLTTSGSRINISYGVMIDYFFSENYSIGTELSIGTFGGTISPDSVYVKNTGTKDLQVNYKLQYINLPFILKMRTKEIGYTRFYAEAGFGMSFNFRAKADVSSSNSALNRTNIDVNNPDPSDKEYINFNNNGLSPKVNFFRFSFILGAGVQYNIFGNTMLIAGLRYDNSISNFTDESSWKANMNFVALHFGVLF
ncbi:MAG: porin family protein [Bacteroidia bacterium]